MAKRVVILGATGSLGRTALRVVQESKEFTIEGLSAGRCSTKLLELKKNLEIPLVACEKGGGVQHSEGLIFGGDAQERLLKRLVPEIVINTVQGIAGLKPALAALSMGMELLMGSKESILVGGSFLKSHLIKPLDSEHVALSELLKIIEDRKDIEEIVITGTGGPLRDRVDLNDVDVEDVLGHPVWPMGPKITVDSATLINKAFEVLEAVYLFGVDPDQTKLYKAPEAMVHAAVRTMSKGWLVHTGPPDMKRVVQNQLGLASWGRILEGDAAEQVMSRLEPFEAGSLAWTGHELLKRGERAVAAFVGIDEVAVRTFLNKRITFLQLKELLEEAVELIPQGSCSDIDDCLRSYDMGISIGSMLIDTL